MWWMTLLLARHRVCHGHIRRIARWLIARSTWCGVLIGSSLLLPVEVVSSQVATPLWLNIHCSAVVLLVVRYNHVWLVFQFVGIRTPPMHHHWVECYLLAGKVKSSLEVADVVGTISFSLLTYWYCVVTGTSCAHGIEPSPPWTICRIAMREFRHGFAIYEWLTSLLKE